LDSAPAGRNGRVTVLLRDAIALDESFKDGGRLWEVIVYDWGVEAPRSRRGRKRTIDPQEIDRLMSSGMSAKDVAEKFGVHPKTPFNVLNRHRKRQI
jgi:hypothetical protein